MLLRVENGARVLQVRQPALIAHGNERRRGLALQPRTHDGVCRLGQGAFEVLERGEAVAGELADAAHLLFERQLLVGEPERLRALERTAIRRQRLVVREHPLGLGRRLPREGQPLVVHAGLDVVVRQPLDRDATQVPAALEPLGGAEVQPPPAHRVQLLVQHLADLVVREREGVAPSRHEELGRHRLVERIQQRVFVAIARRLGQLAEREHLAEDGRRAQHVIGLLADAIETAADRRLHALRQLQLADRGVDPAAVLAAHGALLDERLEDLLDEERVSVRLAVERGAEVGADLLAEQRRELRVRVLRAEPLQHDAGREALAVPLDERLRQRMRAIELALAVGGHQQHGGIGETPQQVAEQPQCGAVGPVQVVDVEQQAATPGKRTEERGHGVRTGAAPRVRANRRAPLPDRRGREAPA